MSVISAPHPRFQRSPLRDPSPDATRRRRSATAVDAVPGLPGPPSTRPQLEVVPDVRRSARTRRLTRRALVVVAILATLSAPFALVLVHVELTANQLRLTSLQTRGDLAQKDYEKLRLQVAQLESPTRVVATAEQLGMVTPTTIHYVTASPNSAVPGAAPVMTSVQPQASPGVDGWATAKRVDTGR